MRMIEMLRRDNRQGHTQKQQLPRWVAIVLALLADSQAAMAQALAPDTTAGRIAVVVTSGLVVILCVVVHYESLSYLSGFLKRVNMKPRPRILLLIFSILGIHVVEIWIFGGAYFWLSADAGRGALVANHPVGLLDSIYFSAVCFTTLGLGDVVPMGAVRFLAGTEALTGFVLVTWSASFTFVEMQRFWKE